MPASDAIRNVLPPDARSELDFILAEARDDGVRVDAEAIARALLKRRISAALDVVPALPSSLARVVDGDDGRYYELTLDLNPTSPETMVSAQRQYEVECRAVATLVAQGMTIPDAWAWLRKRLRLDKQPRRRRVRQAQRRATLTPGVNGPANAETASAPGSAAVEPPVTTPKPSPPSSPPQKPILSVIVGGRSEPHWIGGET
jgi:hypothetical protein